jgi:hypothetical protein
VVTIPVSGNIDRKDNLSHRAPFHLMPFDPVTFFRGCVAEAKIPIRSFFGLTSIGSSSNRPQLPECHIESYDVSVV